MVFLVGQSLHFFDLLSGVETFEQGRYTTSNQYALVFLFLAANSFNKLSTANHIGLNAVPGHYIIRSWHNFGDSDTTNWIPPHP